MKKMDIIYEDKELLVVNKPSGLLTIATEKESIHTLYHQAREYIKKQNPKNKIFIVHRLDKDTSGVVVFAKNEVLKKRLQNNWENVAVVREYIAIVEGKVEKKRDSLKQYLVEDKTYRVHVANKKTDMYAITNYETLHSTKAYSLLKINIQTGKKNQIRVQLGSIGHPIVGDKKYGSQKNPMGRMGLHASVVKVKIGEKIFVWKAKLPIEFKRMFESEMEIYEKKIND